jgi:hypothetical protein
LIIRMPMSDDSRSSKLGPPQGSEGTEVMKVTTTIALALASRQPPQEKVLRIKANDDFLVLR